MFALSLLMALRCYTSLPSRGERSPLQKCCSESALHTFAAAMRAFRRPARRRIDNKPTSKTEAAFDSTEAIGRRNESLLEIIGNYVFFYWRSRQKATTATRSHREPRTPRLGISFSREARLLLFSKELRWITATKSHQIAWCDFDNLSKPVTSKWKHFLSMMHSN